MKYLVLIPDGMADEPIEALGGRTPMEAAHKPTMDLLAKSATVNGLKRPRRNGARERYREYGDSLL